MKITNLRKILLLTLSLGCLATVPMAARAQETGGSDRWKFNAALYLWGAGIKSTTQRDNEIDIGFSDIVENLDMTFMGAFEARKSKWSLAADVVYLDVSADESGTIGQNLPVNADVGLTGWVVNLQGARNLVDSERARLEFLAGARYLDVESELMLRFGEAGPTPSASPSGDVWDAVIGVKGKVNLSPKWYLPYYLDAGAGESDLTWQAVGGVGYGFKHVNLILVYRHMHWDFGSDSALKDMTFSGPALGVVFKF